LKCLKLINEWLRLYNLNFPIFFQLNEMFESHRISSLNICNTFVHMHKEGLSVQTVITPIIWWWLGAVPSLYVWVHRRQEWQISRTHTWLVSKDFSVCVGSLKGKISGWSTSDSVLVPYKNCHFLSIGLEIVLRALGYLIRWYEESLCLKEKRLCEKVLGKTNKNNIIFEVLKGVTMNVMPCRPMEVQVDCTASHLKK
jgi:hypothetical protein